MFKIPNWKTLDFTVQLRLLSGRRTPHHWVATLRPTANSFTLRFRNPSLTQWGLPSGYWRPVPTGFSRSAERPSQETRACPRMCSWSHSRSSSVPMTSPRRPNSWSPSPPKRTTAELHGAVLLSSSWVRLQLRHELFRFLQKHLMMIWNFFKKKSQYYFCMFSNRFPTWFNHCLTCACSQLSSCLLRCHQVLRSGPDVFKRHCSEFATTSQPLKLSTHGENYNWYF